MRSSRYRSSGSTLPRPSSQAGALSAASGSASPGWKAKSGRDGERAAAPWGRCAVPRATQPRVSAAGGLYPEAGEAQKTVTAAGYWVIAEPAGCRVPVPWECGSTRPTGGDGFPVPRESRFPGPDLADIEAAPAVSAPNPPANAGPPAALAWSHVGRGSGIRGREIRRAPDGKTGLETLPSKSLDVTIQDGSRPVPTAFAIARADGRGCGDPPARGASPVHSGETGRPAAGRSRGPGKPYGTKHNGEPTWPNGLPKRS
jgi:hypothetical protein